MDQRFRFTTTRRLLLGTAVLAVWVAVFAIGYQTFPSNPDDSLVWLLFGWASLFIPAALAAIIVRALGKRSILAACCGGAAYVALIAFLSWVGWL